MGKAIGKACTKKNKAKGKGRVRSVYETALGRPVPKSAVPRMRLLFTKGKKKIRRSKKLRFLNRIQFPYEKSGKVRKDFRKLVKERVTNRMPDLCEETKIEFTKKKERECKRIAERIKKRIIERKKTKSC